MHLQTGELVSPIQAVTLRLLPGEDLKERLDEFVKKYQIKAACIITCVGSLEQAAIRYADIAKAEILSGKFEIVSLTGTLAEKGSHIHICISDNTGQTIGGHLKEGSIIYTTAELVLGILTAVSFERKTEPTYGFKELVVTKAT